MNDPAAGKVSDGRPAGTPLQRTRIMDEASFTQRITSVFDARTNYDEQAPSWHLPLAEELVRLAALKKGASVLDVATGTGLVGELAAQAVGSTGSVLGIDISEGMLAQAAPKAAAHPHVLSFRLGDAQTAAFPPGSFDAVLCSNALVYMADVAAALQRWAVWLRPGGILCFNTPQAPFFRSTEVFLHAAEAQGLLLEDVTQVVGSVHSVRSVLQAAGFLEADIQVRGRPAQEFPDINVATYSFASPEEYAARLWSTHVRFYPVESALKPKALAAMRAEWEEGALQQAQRLRQADGRIVDSPTMLWVRATKR
ncbi:hypothetical protein WJX72_006554 [[Myrmecia] bisecta]|uniref:Methyltransferase domain-containing protein n=1 Tax=[Myrmecia] bisecta TaxID=41462 RepID=A0AAW1PTL1_9CHLO